MKNTSIQERANEILKADSPYFTWLIWLIWLPFAIPAIVNIFYTPLSWPILTLVLVCLVLFFSVYLRTSWRRAQRLRAPAPLTEDRTAWISLLLLVAIPCILILIDGKGWLILFYFISGYVGGGFSLKRIFQIMSGILLLIAIIELFNHESRLIIVQTALPIYAVSFMAFIITHSVRTNVELRTAREEVARLAVMTERLRIARDLHDLLGHNLSLIALKSELAGRLISLSPERAIVEIGDVEQVARTTLQEVREAVASYRQSTLANELHGAQEILAAAGIVYDYEDTGNGSESLPSAIEAVLAWTVREGVTNIIKHSRAQHCSIHMKRDEQEVQIEILNDRAMSPCIEQEKGTLAPSSGNGLRGLSERVEALNGHFDAILLPNGDFSLSVSLRLTQKFEKTGTTPMLIAPLQESGNHKERNKQR